MMEDKNIDMVDLSLVKSNDTGIIQEVHIAICHMICEICEDVLKMDRNINMPSWKR